LDLDDLKSKFGSRFLEVFDLLVAVGSPGTGTGLD
jgi:hypothetical protein